MQHARREADSRDEAGRGMIRGMTGFGRAQGQGPWGAWVWEARSVNGKAVDLRTNFPSGL